MMGLTTQQKNCVDFLRSYRDERGVMPSFQEIANHMGLKSLSRIHFLMLSLEERGVIRRLASKARAIELVEPNSMQAVLLHSDTYRIAQLYAGSRPDQRRYRRQRHHPGTAWGGGMIDIIQAVPFGHDNAISSREIWRSNDCWAENTIGMCLNKLAEDLAIKRRQQPTHGIAFRWIYWREAAA